VIAAQLMYYDVPAQVSRVSAYGWHRDTAPVPLRFAITRGPHTVTIALTAQEPVVVMLQRADGSYLLDGPVTPRDVPIERRLDGVWRRSVLGSVTSPPDSTPLLEWISADGGGGGWPACWWTSGARWECIGVPSDASGVVTAAQGERLLAATVTGASAPVLRPSAWGRLAVVADAAGEAPPRLEFIAAEPVLPRERARTVRWESRAVDLRVSSLARGMVWLAGDSSPPDAWLEIRSARSGPQFMSLAEVAQGPPQVPLRILLEGRRNVDLTVLSNQGVVVAGALVAVFRLIDRTPAVLPPGQPPPRRVLTREQTTTADGTLVLEGLGDADYELVAWHPRFGRASVRLMPGPVPVTIRLQPTGVARGRVLSGGQPAAGVDVLSAPDPEAYSTAADPIDLKGGDARTGADGRFAVALAPLAGGELRIGGGRYPTVRVTLPRLALPLVELGDIELGRAIALSIVLDQDPGCDLRVTGPIGKTGLRMIAATRTGPGLFSITLPEEGSWEFVLSCGRVERAVAPAVVTFSAHDGPRDVHLIVR
jgi:hypothetical protein